MSNEDDKYVVELNEIDVLCGRGSGPNDRAGNIEFRNLVLSRKVEYLAATTRDAKGRIAAEIVANVRSRGGRFLKKLSPQQAKDAGFKRGVAVYELADEPTVLEKAKQTLRQNRADFVAKVAQGQVEGIHSNNLGGQVNGGADMCRLQMGDAPTPLIRGGGPASCGHGGDNTINSGNYGYSQNNNMANSSAAMSLNPIPLDSSNAQLDSMQRPIMSNSTAQELNQKLFASSGLNSMGAGTGGSSSSGSNTSGNRNMQMLNRAAQMVNSGGSGGSLNTEAANAIYAALEGNQSQASSGKSNVSNISTNSADAFEALIKEYNAKEQQILMQQFNQLKSQQQEIQHLQRQFEQQQNDYDFQPQNVTSTRCDNGGVPMTFIPENQQAQFDRRFNKNQMQQQDNYEHQQNYQQNYQQQQFRQQQRQQYQQQQRQEYQQQQQQRQNFDGRSNDNSPSVFDSVVRHYDYADQNSQLQGPYNQGNHTSEDMPFMNRVGDYHFPAKRSSDSSDGGFGAADDEQRALFQQYKSDQQNKFLQRYEMSNYNNGGNQNDIPGRQNDGVAGYSPTRHNAPYGNGGMGIKPPTNREKQINFQTDFGNAEPAGFHNTSEESLRLDSLKANWPENTPKVDEPNSNLKASTSVKVEPADFKNDTEQSLRLSFVTANRLAATLTQDMSTGSIGGQNTTAALKRQGNTNRRRSMPSFNNSEQSMMSLMSLSLSLSEISQDMFRSSTKLSNKPDSTKNANDKDERKSSPNRPGEVITENSVMQMSQIGELSMSLNPMEESWANFSPPNNEDNDSG